MQAYSEAKQCCELALSIIDSVAEPDNTWKKLRSMLSFNLLNLLSLTEATQEARGEFADQFLDYGKKFIAASFWGGAIYCFEKALPHIDVKTNLALSRLADHLDQQCSRYPGQQYNDQDTIALSLHLKELLTLLAADKEKISDYPVIETIMRSIDYLVERYQAFPAAETACHQVLALVTREDYTLWLYCHLRLFQDQQRKGMEISEESLNEILQEDEIRKHHQNAQIDDWNILLMLFEIGKHFDDQEQYSRSHFCYDIVFHTMDIEKDECFHNCIENMGKWLSYGKTLVKAELQLEKPTKKTLNKILLIKNKTALKYYDYEIAEKLDEIGHLFLERRKFSKAENCYQTSTDLVFINLEKAFENYGNEIFFYLARHTHYLIKAQLSQDNDIQQPLDLLFATIQNNTQQYKNGHDGEEWETCISLFVSELVDLGKLISHQPYSDLLPVAEQCFFHAYKIELLLPADKRSGNALHKLKEHYQRYGKKTELIDALIGMVSAFYVQDFCNHFTRLNFICLMMIMENYPNAMELQLVKLSLEQMKNAVGLNSLALGNIPHQIDRLQKTLETLLKCPHPSLQSLITEFEVVKERVAKLESEKSVNENQIDDNRKPAEKRKYKGDDLPGLFSPKKLKETTEGMNEEKQLGFRQG